MSQPLSGPGLGLPYPQNYYPSQLQNAPQDPSSNRLALAAGDTFVIPAGDWYINTGCYSVLQYLDPVTNIWSMTPTAAWGGALQFIKSDGFTTRIANLLNCPVSAVITQSGGGWVQSSTTITATGGTSTWLPIIGGALAQVGGTMQSVGAGYGIAPLVMIPPPPPAANNANGVGGVQASAYCVISSGTVSGFTFSNVGAGYPSAPTAVVVPSPFDPNLATGITAATVAFSLTNAGALTGVFCTNPGAPLSASNAITLGIAGAGTNATLVANVLTSVTAVTVSGAGSGYGTISALLTTIGGAPSVGTITNPDLSGLAWRPRPAQVGLAVTAAANGTIAAQNGTIFDGGLFLQSTTTAPNFVVIAQPITAATQAYVAATIALTMGTRADIVTLQPAP